MIRKTTTLLFCLALLAGLFGVLPGAVASDPHLAMLTEPFDTEDNWSNISGGSVTVFGTQAYSNPATLEVTFRAEAARRLSGATQDGYPICHSEPYVWQLRDTEAPFWQATVTTGGVETFSVWVRRWDGSPEPVYVVEYSINNGDSWTTVLTIDNAWLDSSSAWKQVSGTINTPNDTGADDDIIIRIRRVSGERLLVDDFEMTDNPLAVTLASFTAEPQSGHILVSWETVSEIDNAGFNLYRTDSAGAQPLPADLLAYVPSQAPGSTQGVFYSYVDADVVAGQTYWYWLADVDLSGVATLHGPVSATASAPTAVTFAGLATANAAAGHALPLAGAVLALLLPLAGAAWAQRRRP
jgi:hypothetical protein